MPEIAANAGLRSGVPTWIVAPDGPIDSPCCIVPVKSFRCAKHRLGAILNAEQRATLARSMAEQVLNSATGVPTVVTCDDPTVATWAAQRGAFVAWTPMLGLNGAVNSALRMVFDLHAPRAWVVHSDLPLVRELRIIDDPNGITLVPDRQRIGTTAACIPAGVPWYFTFGPMSFSLHLTRARTASVPVRVLSGTDLSHDLDVPGDISSTTWQLLRRAEGRMPN